VLAAALLYLLQVAPLLRVSQWQGVRYRAEDRAAACYLRSARPIYNLAITIYYAAMPADLS
jgi:hypothetical protein